MAMEGADAAQLRALARRLRVARTTIETQAHQLTATLAASPWQGTDAGRFRAAWNNQHRRSLGTVLAALTDAATSLEHNATQQEEASAAGGGSGSGSSDTGSSDTGSGGPGPLPPAQARLVAAVDAGTLTDPEAAFQLPMSDYTDAGITTLLTWATNIEHRYQIGSWIASGDKINLPPSPAGYQLAVHALDQENIKLTYTLAIPAGTAATALTVTGALAARPTISGTLTGSDDEDDGGEEDSVDVDDHGWSISAMKSIGADKVGLSWHHDGPWLQASHDADLDLHGTDALLRSELAVRVPAGQTPRPAPEPWYVHAARTAAQTAEVPLEVGKAAVQAAGHAAGVAADWYLDQPVGTKILIGAGLAVVVLPAAEGGAAVVAAG